MSDEDELKRLICSETEKAVNDARSTLRAGVHEEVERWKSLHDQEIARRQRLSWAAPLATVLGALAGLGVGWNTVQGSIDRGILEQLPAAIEDKREFIEGPYTRAMDTLLDSVIEAADKTRSEAEKAKSAVEQSSKSAIAAAALAEEARSAAEAAGAGLRKKINEILEGDSGLASTRSLLEEVIDPMRAIIEKHDRILGEQETVVVGAHDAGALKGKDKIVEIAFDRKFIESPRVYVWVSGFGAPGSDPILDAYVEVDTIGKSGLTLKYTVAPYEKAWLHFNWMAIGRLEPD